MRPSRRSMQRAILYLTAAVALDASGPIRIVVDRQELVTQPSTPLIYGNFIESGFGRQTDGMRAEMLFNRSFEAIPPLKRNWLKYPPAADLTQTPWWHSGYEEDLWHL